MFSMSLLHKTLYIGKRYERYFQNSTLYSRHVPAINELTEIDHAIKLTKYLKNKVFLYKFISRFPKNLFVHIQKKKEFS